MKIFDSIVTICTALLVLFIVLNAAAGYEVFVSFELIQLLPSFDFIFWVLASMSLVLVIAAGGKRIALLIVFFILSIQLIFRHSDHSFDLSVEHSSKDTLKVLSLNVGQFSNDTAVVNQCIHLIRSEKADIVCLQEFGLYYKWPDVESVASDFARRTGFKYYDFSPKQGNIFGTAIFSKHEITQIDTVFQLLSHTNEAKLYQLDVNGISITVANIHLQSYNLFSSRDSLSLSSIRKAIAMRNEQVKMIIKTQSDIMLGDFNASPGTIVHNLLCDEYIDVQGSFGNAFSPTLQVFPTRLDYVFVGSRFVVNSSYLNARFPSDHKALVAKIAI